jgi:hypothetical protein
MALSKVASVKTVISFSIGKSSSSTHKEKDNKLIIVRNTRKTTKFISL